MSQTTKSTSFSLNKDVLERLNKYSEKSMISKTKIVERAIIEYLDNVEQTFYELSPDWKPLTDEEIAQQRVQRAEAAYLSGELQREDYLVCKKFNNCITDEELKELDKLQESPTTTIIYADQ